MREDMQLRGLAARTQEAYLAAVRQLAVHYARSPDLLSEDELRQYFLYLRNEKQVAPNTAHVALNAIRFLFVQTLQRAWPLQTGGMPIVAMWPNLVVIFELTMLFAIVATVVTLLVTAKLPRRRPALYDPEVSNGRILVGLEDPRVPLETIERALAWRGGISLKTIQ